MFVALWGSESGDESGHDEGDGDQGKDHKKTSLKWLIMDYYRLSRLSFAFLDYTRLGMR